MKRSLAPSILLLTACGAGGAAEAVRPKEATAAAALEEAECRDVSRGAEPLVVDWSAEQRGNLEVAMKDGVAVVAYDCKGMRLLEDCKLEGTYGYTGMTRKEQVVRLESSDEARANLPLTGVSIGAELDRGATLEVAMILVGKRRTTWRDPGAGDLSGKCDGATHYVRGASVGAFALSTGTRAKVRASAEVFAAGVSSGSQSSRQASNKEGDPAECAKAAPDSVSPPSQCGAPVRLVLAPILPKAAADAPPAVAPTASEPTCPTGLVLAEGKCAKPEATAAHECKPGDQADCAAQCEKGHPGSCRLLAEVLAAGGKGDAAAEALTKGCSGGDARACAMLGSQVAARDPAAAAKHFETACTGGDAPGCTALGRAVAASDAKRSLSLFENGCNGGDAAGCAEAGERLFAGEGAAKDRGRALDLLRRACDGGIAASCSRLGELYEGGEPGTPRQPILAEMLLRRGCARGSAEACVGTGRVLATKPGGAASPEVKGLFERGCAGRAVHGCAALKVVFGEQRPVFADPAQKQALTKACVTGNARACANAALLDAAMGNSAMAKPALQRACTMGDAWACYLGTAIK